MCCHLWLNRQLKVFYTVFCASISKKLSITLYVLVNERLSHRYCSGLLIHDRCLEKKSQKRSYEFFLNHALRLNQIQNPLEENSQLKKTQYHLQYIDSILILIYYRKSSKCVVKTCDIHVLWQGFEHARKLINKCNTFRVFIEALQNFFSTFFLRLAFCIFFLYFVFFVLSSAFCLLYFVILSFFFCVLSFCVFFLYFFFWILYFLYFVFLYFVQEPISHVDNFK